MLDGRILSRRVASRWLTTSCSPSTPLACHSAVLTKRTPIIWAPKEAVRFGAPTLRGELIRSCCGCSCQARKSVQASPSPAVTDTHMTCAHGGGHAVLFEPCRLGMRDEPLDFAYQPADIYRIGRDDCLHWSVSWVVLRIFPKQTDDSLRS